MQVLSMIPLWSTLLINMKAAVYFMYKNQFILCEENIKCNMRQQN